MPDKELHLVLPHYASLFANPINHAVCPPALHKLTQKGRFQQSADSLERALLRLFQAESDSADLPVSLLKTGQNNAVLVSPCHVYADRGRLLLFYRDIHLSVDERSEFYHFLKMIFADYGWTLHTNEQGDWYLYADESEPLPSFTALTELEGRPVLDVLPKGRNADQWINMWNALQMTLFDCPLNLQREAQRKFAVNSVWFWGCGQWSQPPHSWQQIYGQHELLTLLANKTATPLQPFISEQGQFALKDSLICLPELNWQADSSEQLQQLENHIFKPVWQALRYWRLKRVTLIVPDWGRYTVTPLDSWKLSL